MSSQSNRYFQETVEKNGWGKQVIISANTPEGPFSSRLYVNGGETATLVSAKAKTLAGARRQAWRMLAR